MFKEKKSKKKQILSSNKNHETTLDEKHKQMISTIESQIEKKDTLLQQKAKYEKEKAILSDLITEYYNSNINEGVEYDMIWDSNIYCSDKLQEIDKKISLINDVDYEIEYYENTGTILFDYYELLNQQENNNISSANNNVLNIPKPQGKGKSKMLPINQKNILEAFKIPNENDTDEDNSDIEDEIPSESIKDKTTLVNEYLLAIDDNHMKTLNDNLKSKSLRFGH